MSGENAGDGAKAGDGDARITIVLKVPRKTLEQLDAEAREQYRCRGNLVSMIVRRHYGEGSVK